MVEFSVMRWMGMEMGGEGFFKRNAFFEVGVCCILV